MRKLSLSVLLLFCISLGSFAQEERKTFKLTEEERKAFEVQCQERIDAFQMGLEIIADKQQSGELKNHYISTILDMFMGKGEPWKDVNGEDHPAVKMQVSSVNSGKTNDVPLKKYLPALRDLEQYTYVEIKKAKTCVLSNFHPISDKMYMATCAFFQYFTGKKGEVLVYKDFTQKDVDVYIQYVEDGALGAYWDMKFGDINVTETRKL